MTSVQLTAMLLCNYSSEHHLSLSFMLVQVRGWTAVMCTYLCEMLGSKSRLETCSFFKDELLQCLFG